MPHAFSTLKSILPAFSSLTALAISKVTVPVFALGMSPRGPNIFPIFPTVPIMSGVATALSKHIKMKVVYYLSLYIKLVSGALIEVSRLY